MDITINKVTSIEIEDPHESSNATRGDLFWRDLVIKTDAGDVRISLYAPDIDNLKVLV